jgi:hypothetical protein
VDEYSRALLNRVEVVLPQWVEREVRRLMIAWQGDAPGDVMQQARFAGERAGVDIGDAMGRLLEQDIDAQRTNPMSILRQAVRYPTEVLKAAGVPEVRRPEFEERNFPDDVYNLTPAAWRDVDESLHEVGLVWGAWKAKQHLSRRRAEGKLD